MPKALITGITGQDGSYMAEYLLEKGYQVYGLVRRTSTVSDERINHILDKIEILEGDLLDQHSLTHAVKKVKPDEIYNFAAQSFIPTSFNQPVLTGEATALGVTRMLEAMHIAAPKAHFYQASSSEMFGKAQETPQNEKTPFYPRSPYGVAKVYGHWITINYREAYSLYAVSGIAFNHESPRRGIEFVTRKITRAVAKIKLRKQNKLVLGNLDAKRDWGFAKDYVEAMHLILQQAKPNDYVIGTGVSHSVRDFVKAAFTVVGIKNWQKYVETDPKFYRPAEVNALIADPTKIKKKIGWQPKTSFEELVKLMVESDLEKEKLLKGVTPY